MSNFEKLDKIDIEIIRNLWDGRTPYSEIAEKINLTTNTVRNRVNKMLEQGALQIISLVDPAAIEGHHSAFIGITVEPQKTKAAMTKIMGLKGIVGVTMVSGRFDIMAVLLYNDEFTYERFLDEELLQVDGLLKSETFFTIGGANFQLRYVL